jgi:hypothetical protein
MLRNSACHVKTVFHGSTALEDLGLFLVEVPRSHSDTTHSVGLLSTSDRTEAEKSTWYFKQLGCCLRGKSVTNNVHRLSLQSTVNLWQAMCTGCHYSRLPAAAFLWTLSPVLTSFLSVALSGYSHASADLTFGKSHRVLHYLGGDLKASAKGSLMFNVVT